LTVNRKTSNMSLSMYKIEVSTGLFLIGILALSCLSTNIFKQNQALAQQYIQTIKYRNLVIDLGNGVKTNARFSLLVSVSYIFCCMFVHRSVMLCMTNCTAFNFGRRYYFISGRYALPKYALTFGLYR